MPNNPLPPRRKKPIVRIVILIIAFLLVLGIIVIPIRSSLAVTVSAEEASSVLVKEFETGKLSEALLEAAGGTDYNYIKKAAVLSGTMSAADFNALQSIPNLEYVELAGTEAENGIIPENALPSRNQLAYISLPKNTREIGKGAFSGNRKLEKISMPDTVEIIGDYAFDACEALVSVPITANVTYIGEGAFRDCKSVSEFTIPAGITEIYPYTFSKCGFSEIIIGPDVKSIGDGAFADCNNLKDIYSYAAEAPSIAGAGTFQNVGATIHVYDGSGESYASWEGNNIKAAEDLTGDYPVAAAEEKPAETTATEEGIPIDDVTPVSEESETEAALSESLPEPTEAAAEPAAQPAGGLSVGVVIVIVLMAVVIAVLATILIMGKKNRN